MERKREGEMQEQASRVKASAASDLTGNERGMVLVLALATLALLTILGAWVLDTSSTDLKIAGNSRNAQNAFCSADAALAYAANPEMLETAYLYTKATGSSAVWSQVISIGTYTANTSITFLGSGPLPAGSIYDGDLEVNGNPKFHGNYFIVNTEGKAAHNADVAVESAFVQVVGN